MRLAELNHKALAILLTAICLIGLSAVALEMRYPPRLDPPSEIHSNADSVSAAPARKKAAKEVALLPLDDYGEIMARPLFRPDRRPPPPEPEAPAKAMTPQEIKKAQQMKVQIEDLFVLNGVVITHQKAIALLHDIKNNKSLRANEGEVLQGRKIKLIFPDHVLFSHNGRSEILELIRNVDPKERQRLRRQAQRKG